MNAPQDGKSTDPKGTLETALSRGFQLLKQDPALAAEQAGEISTVVKSPIQNCYFADHALANRLESIRIDAT